MVWDYQSLITEAVGITIREQEERQNGADTFGNRQ